MRRIFLNRLLLLLVPLLALFRRVFSFPVLIPGSSKRSSPTVSRRESPKYMVPSDEDDDNDNVFSSKNNRRALLLTAGTLLPLQVSALDFGSFGTKKGGKLYIVDTKDQSSDSVRTEQVDTPVPTLSSEYALLKVLPVKNPVFRTLEQNIEALSALRFGAGDDESKKDATWTKARKSIQTALTVLTKQRAQLEPVFNPEDSTELAILKGERGEILIEDLRDELLSLSNAASLCNTTCLFAKQKNALLALGYLGELLVKEYPYQVPSRGRFSFLPRLLGRCKVTFRMKRAGAILGNITIMADGYIAPITAGNFVDLSLRNFYTGLALKSVNKKFGNLSEQVAAPINVLGSYNEGFYDPLTAKLREIPLEIIRLERGSGQPKLSYSTRGFSDTSRSVDMPGEASSIPSLNSKPLLTFGAPGLIAFHHPDKNPNGGSSEFFGLQPDTMPEGKNALLDGDYAPFGFMIDGYDIFSSLDPDDVIDATFVDGFGQLNLVKIRESSFKEAAQGSEVETS